MNCSINFCRLYLLYRSLNSRALSSCSEKFSSNVVQNFSEVFVASSLKKCLQPSTSHFSRVPDTSRGSVLAFIPGALQKSPLMASRGGELSRVPINFPATLKDVSILDRLDKEAIKLEDCTKNECGFQEEDETDVTPTPRLYCSSILKKRRKKMNRHKYRKWRKRMRFVRRALKN